MKKLLIALCVLPLLCAADKKDCKDIRKMINDNGVKVYTSPVLKHLSVIEEMRNPVLFVLHLHIKHDMEAFDKHGASIEFEDGSVISEEEANVHCSEEVSALYSSTSIGTSSGSGKYLLQGFIHITGDNIEKFISKKIVRIQLYDISRSIQGDEAEKIKAYAKCLWEMK